MFMFKRTKKEELLKGRTISYIASEVGITKEFLTSVLNEKRTCSKTIAYCLTKISDSDKEINYFFTQQKGE